MISARECALRILYQVEGQSAYSNIVVDDVVHRNLASTFDKNFTVQLVYGVLRRLNTLDYFIKLFLDKPERFPRMNKWLLLILRLGVYQIIYMDKVPHYSAVDESVKLAKAFGPVGSSKFVNAVLRNVCENAEKITRFRDVPPEEAMALKYSHPSWLINRWVSEFSEESAKALLKANNTPPPFTIRTNTLKISRDELLTMLEPFKVSPTKMAPEGIIVRNIVDIIQHDAFKNGLFYIQDEASMMVAHVVDPKEMELIMDLCASPGGKTTHMAQLANDQAIIIAFDRFSHKIQKIKDNLRRLGINGVTARLQDVLKLKSEREVHKVLVDAPCSCTGIIRRHPELKWRIRPESITEVAELQAQLLRKGAEHVTKGGTLVYSVCSIEPEETIELITEFTVQHPEFKLAPFPEKVIAMIEKNYDASTAKKGYIYFVPHIHDTDGFFVARLERH